MRRILLAVAAVAVCALALSQVLADTPAKALAPDDVAYAAVVDRTAGMLGDAEAIALAQKHGLQVLNVTWEDAGRFKNSAVGPNISDMTIQVRCKDPKSGQDRIVCMPVIRFPNFEDKTADLDPTKFSLLVGNEKGRDLTRIHLMEMLANPRKYLTKAGSWKGNGTYLHASRDNRVLVSAQACFLPVPKQGIAEFNPVLFNYQSMKDDPAVLTILATREGTSVTVIDNARDGFSVPGGVWGQRLFFNKNGERASFTGQRLSDFQAGNNTGSGGVSAGDQKGLNMVLLIQVPLKQKKPMEFGAPGGMLLQEGIALSNVDVGVDRRRSDVEAAVIGHGKVEGPFTEIADLDIERDPKFPVRVTVQFYKATSNGVVSEKDVADIAAEIDRVYKEGDFVGSLVTQGMTNRPTEYEGDKIEPPDWWEQFWKRHEQRTGYSRDETVAALRTAHGAEWVPICEADLAHEAEAFTFPEPRIGRRAVLQITKWWPVLVVAGLMVAGFILRWRARTATAAG
jgi:hypothetical protein